MKKKKPPPVHQRSFAYIFLITTVFRMKKINNNNLPKAVVDDP